MDIKKPNMPCYICPKLKGSAYACVIVKCPVHGVPDPTVDRIKYSGGKEKKGFASAERMVKKNMEHMFAFPSLNGV